MFAPQNGNNADQSQTQMSGENTQNNYDSYDIYRPTPMNRSASEFSAYSHFDDYYNEFTRNKKNQFYFDSYPNDFKTDRYFI